MNEVIDACKVQGRKTGKASKRWNKYADMKRKWGENIAALAIHQKFPKIDKGAIFTYIFMEPDRRRDPSNFVSGGVKVIEDGLQQCGLLENDGWEHVNGIILLWDVDPVNPGCLVYVDYEETA